MRWGCAGGRLHPDATVRTAAGEGVRIAGNRRSGKSTTALLVSERLGAHVLCDETALIHCRTTVVEPFPHSVGMWRNGHKVQTPITEVRTGSASVADLPAVAIRRAADPAAPSRTYRVLVDRVLRAPCAARPGARLH
ncbi:MAG: hypothetical protein WCF33_14625 [Pseudonocardiaceae bacterium]